MPMSKMLAIDARRLRPPERLVARGDVDGTIAMVFVPIEEVRRLLPEGLVLEPVPGVPDGRHPMWVGMDNVTNGRFSVGGVGHPELYARAGGAVGRGVGAVEGAMVDAALGAVRRIWLGPLGMAVGAVAGI